MDPAWNSSAVDLNRDALARDNRICRGALLVGSVVALDARQDVLARRCVAVLLVEVGEQLVGQPLGVPGPEGLLAPRAPEGELRHAYQCGAGPQLVELAASPRPIASAWAVVPP